MIYLNQAATTWPKPKQVEEAVRTAFILPPFSQHRAADGMERPDIQTQCRQKLRRLFIPSADRREGDNPQFDPSRIYFTSGATEAYNRIVRGLQLEGKRVVAAQDSHNAVLRPLYNICKNTEIVVAGCDPQGRLLLDDFKSKINENTAAVFVNHCSNVTGMIHPLLQLARMAHEMGSLFVVDVSQSAGAVEIDAAQMGIDILVFTGHKGLYGPQGTGGFYVRPGVHLCPSFFGGTGHDSTRLLLPADSEEHEAGTQNLHGLCGLCAGLDYVLETGISRIRSKEQELTAALKEGLLSMEKVQVYSTSGPSGPLVSFNLLGLKPDDTAYILKNSYNIVVRSGFHCAPLVHQALGCVHGTVRASISYFNTMEEVEVFLTAVREVVQSL